MRITTMLLILFSAGCAMPVTNVRSVDTRPSISISNASDQAELLVDGVRMGRAADFEEPNQLKLEPGTHRVTLVESGKVVVDKTIFIESEHKTITAR